MTEMTQSIQSILHPKFSGVFFCSGLFGIGKTTFATSVEDPQLMGMIDFDFKFEAIAKDLGIWYRCPSGMEAMTKDPMAVDMESLVNWFRQTLQALPVGKTTLVIDNATFLEPILGHIVKKNPTKYGLNAKNVAAGRFGGVNPGVGLLWSNITMFLQSKGIKLIFLVTHMSQPWVDNKPVLNKFQAKGNRVLHQLSNFSVILVEGKSRSEPAGLVMKEQFIIRRFDRETHEHIMISPLPPRLPVARWPVIKNYFEKPYDAAHPKPGELWSPSERETYSKFLSAKQVAFIEAIGSYEEDGEPISSYQPKPTPSPVPKDRNPIKKKHQPVTPRPEPTPSPVPVLKDRKWAEDIRTPNRNIRLGDLTTEQHRLILSSLAEKPSTAFVELREALSILLPPEEEEEPEAEFASPLAAEDLRTHLRTEAAKLSRTHKGDITDKQVAKLAVEMSQALKTVYEGNVDPQRHSVLAYLFSVDSSKELSNAQASALIDHAVEVGSLAFGQELALIVRARMVEQGQQDLPLP